MSSINLDREQLIRKRSKDNPTVMGPDWSLLPTELLLVISEKVALIADYIRFRAVCHPWRSASSQRPDHLPVQAPWLMLPYEFKGNNDDSTHLFYDLSTSKTHSLHLPKTSEVSEVQICGCSHGWLVLHDGKRTTSLFNPVTQTTISLPSYTEPSSLFRIDQVMHWPTFFQEWHQTDHFSISKAILTSSPLNLNCLVIVFIDYLNCLAFCKIGDNGWTMINIFLDSPWRWGLSDFTYSNGFLYTLIPCGPVTIYNLNSPSREVIMSHYFDQDEMYIVEGVFGDILVIESSGRKYEDGLLVNEVKQKIYKISNNKEWIEVTDIGQNMLFVTGYDHAISLSSAHPQLQKWGANCLFYYSERVVEWYPDNDTKLCNHNIKLCRIDDGTVTDITGDLGSFLMTGLRQQLFWLTPSFL